MLEVFEKAESVMAAWTSDTVATRLLEFHFRCVFYLCFIFYKEFAYSNISFVFVSGNETSPILF